jgi:pimeloyl-ACP methyl ester carboxylesterase
MLLRRRYVLPILFVMLWAGCRDCSVLKLRVNDRDLTETLKSMPYPFRVVHQRVGDRSIRFLQAGADSLPMLILLHGSPSSLSAWRPLYTDPRFLSKYQLIAIDRPGYGYSDFGDVVTGLQEQVALLQVVIDSLTRDRKAILLGSSYGGPVAAQLAMNLPDRFSQLVLMSASLEPGQEKTYWISYPMTTPVLRYLFPPTFVISSEEKLAHRQALQSLTQWAKITCPVLLVHGDKDGLVYYRNVEYAKKQLVNASKVKTITMTGKGHSIIFSQPEYIRKLLLQHLLH